MSLASQFVSHLEGQCGLLFTNDSKEVVLDWFKDYSGIEYAKSGFRATETVQLSEGPLEQFSHAIEPHLRSLGMPTKLERGIVTLHKEFTVCEKGKVLTPEQARILKLLGRPMAKFQLFIECCWSKKTGFELFRKRRLVKKVDIEKEKNVPKRSKKKLEKKSKSGKKSHDDGMMETLSGGFIEEDNDDKMEED
jgi:mRNA turnover protein 4